MRRYDPSMVAVAVLLAAVAGFVDAVVFASIGFFASFMSGNSTRLGVGIAQGTSGVAITAGALLLAFIAGVIGSTVVARRFARRRKLAVMIAVTLLLAIAAAGAGRWPQSLVLMIATMAMGAMNGVFARDGEVSIGVTYMTGSLVKMGQGLAGALMGDADRWGWARYLALWLGFAAGAVIGAGTDAMIGTDAMGVAAAAAAALTLVIGVLPAGSGAAIDEARGERG